MVLLGRGLLVFVGSDLFLFLFLCRGWYMVPVCFSMLAWVGAGCHCLFICLFTGIWAVVTVPSFNAHLAGYFGHWLLELYSKSNQTDNRMTQCDHTPNSNASRKTVKRNHITYI